MLLGIDVSSHNDPDSVPYGSASFIFVRATMGARGLDERAFEHLMRARQHRVPLLGVYHFSRADSPGDAQAEHFAGRVADLEQTFGPLALANDVEPLPPPAPSWDRAVYAVTVNRFAEALPIQRPCATYGSPSYLTTLELSPRVCAGPWWLAHWNVATPMLTPMIRSWTVHQYAVLGGIDRNRFRGDEEDFKRAFGLLPPPLPFDVLAGVVTSAQAAAGLGDGGVEDFASYDEGPTIPR